VPGPWFTDRDGRSCGLRGAITGGMASATAVAGTEPATER
jgi:hypothetical protein